MNTRISWSLLASVVTTAVVGSASGCSGCAPADAEQSEPESVSVVSPWGSSIACSHAEPLERSAGAHRIGTWNVRWFPDGTFENAEGDRATDVAWLACAIARLDVDVLAIQEFKKHPRAQRATRQLLDELDELTGGTWRAQLDDCPHENQPHVGFLFDESAVEILGARDVARLNPHEGACEGAQRPGMVAAFRFPDDVEVALVNVHIKSGTTPEDRAYRVDSMDVIESVFRRVARDWTTRDVFFLGDFNTNGCPDCDEPLTANAEVWDLERRLRSFEPALHILPSDASCTEYEHGQPWPLDHVVAPLRGGSLEVSPVHVDGHCDELGCEEGVELPASERELSDHCPLVFEVVARG